MEKSQISLEVLGSRTPNECWFVAVFLLHMNSFTKSQGLGLSAALTTKSMFSQWLPRI